MKVCVWRSGHEIADTVANALNDGLRSHGLELDLDTDEVVPPEIDVHIGYGILRGTDHVWRECERLGKPYFIVDRGYWKPGHYDGYYRVSLRGTQQTSGWPEPDWERWEKLGLTVEKTLIERGSSGGHDLCIPPTDYVNSFFNLGPWLDRQPITRVRFKGSENPLDVDLACCGRVITFNSSVGWEALRRGIPVESDPVHSIVGAWQAKHGIGKREELFATMAGLQLTLDEMRVGKLMPLMEKLLNG